MGPNLYTTAIKFVFSTHVYTTKYLGNILSTKGGIDETIVDRRNKGWGRISTILGILSEFQMGDHKLEAGLLMREAILISGLLYSAETWSGVSERQISRLEVVDNALLVRLTGGHSKCASEYNHLETRTVKLRHHLTYLRLLYHHHILTRDKNETISKIYYKQKEENCKGDWFQSLKKDFEFIKRDMDESKIADTPKSLYKKEIWSLVRKSAFEYLMKLKSTHTKLDKVTYTQLKLQAYLTSSLITQKQKELLYLMRANCYNVKCNFKKLYRNNLACVLGCQQSEDQYHAFTQCQPIRDILKKH